MMYVYVRVEVSGSRDAWTIGPNGDDLKSVPFVEMNFGTSLNGIMGVVISFGNWKKLNGRLLIVLNLIWMRFVSV